MARLSHLPHKPFELSARTQSHAMGRPHPLLPRIAKGALLVLLSALVLGARHSLDPALAYKALGTSNLFLDSALHAVINFKIDRGVAFARTLWEIFGPGGKLHPGWFLEHKGHLVIEGVLVVLIGCLLLQQSFKPRQEVEEAPLTETEI